MGYKAHDKSFMTLSNGDSVATSVDISEREAQGFDASATKKLVRKLDWHLIPFLSLIYLYVLTLKH